MAGVPHEVPQASPKVDRQQRPLMGLAVVEACFPARAVAAGLPHQAVSVLHFLERVEVPRAGCLHRASEAQRLVLAR